MPMPPSASPERRYRPLQRGGGLQLMHCQCRAGVGDRPVDEEHRAFSITLVRRGHFSYRTRGGGALLSPGWLMLGNAGEAYVCSHEHSDGSGDDCTVLSLPEPLLEATLEALGVAVDLRFGHACLPPLPRVAGLFRGLDDDGAEGFALEETALAIVARVRSALRDGEAPAAQLPRQDERARAAAHCIETRSDEALTLDEVAQAAGLSPFHLLRVFRQSIGVTPHQYLMRQRLMHALQLLRDSPLPVTDVAYESGWADLSNFNRAFRREFGCSPRDLRQGDRRLMAAAQKEKRATSCDVAR